MLLIFVIFLLNLCEWYDYSVYLYLFDDDTSWICFAIGYFFAPLGGLFSAILADKISYIYSMSISAFGMSLVSIAYFIFLTYGYKVNSVLYIIRCLHGFCVGGMMCLSFVELLKWDKYNKGILASLPVLAMSVGMWLGYNIVNFIGCKAILIYAVISFFAGLYLFVESSVRSIKIIDMLDIYLISGKVMNSIRSILISTGISSISAFSFFFLTFLIDENIFSIKFDIYYLFFTMFSMCFGGVLCCRVGIIQYFYCLAFILGGINIYIGCMYWFNILLISTKIMYLYILLVFMYMGAEALIHNQLYNINYINVAMVVSYNLGACIFGSLTPCLLFFFQNNYIYYFILYLVVIFFIALFSIYKASDFFD